MKTVLVNKPIHDIALSRLREEVRVLTPFKAPYEELMGLLPGTHGVVLCAGLTMGPVEMDRATELAVIGRHGAGIDIVDVALMLMLARARRLPQLDRAVRSGNFHIRDRVIGQELEGRALGIVGFGRIGRRLAEICREGLHMPVYFFDPYVDGETAAACQAVQVNDLAELAGLVDILSIHSPLTEETHHLVSGDVLQAMKPGAMLVNVSRGPVVDEAALIEALQSGHLGGAGLDVYESEPPSPDNPLFQMDQVALTPHLASFTEEGRRRMGLMAVEEVLRALRGEKPLHLANPEVWEHRRALT
jgi:D-3-phosphoglycerate dehydrogenase